MVAEPQPPQTPISPMQQMGHERRRKAHHSVESDSDGNQRLDDARTKSNVSSSTGATSCGMNMEKVVVSESSGHNLVVNPNFVDTSHDNASVHRSETPSTNTTPSSLPDSHPNRSYGARTSSNSSTTGSSCGSGVSYTDELLITILKDKPKNREELRTERNYKGFFRGMSKKRMHYLLVTAYSHATSNGVVLTEQERNDKVNKRMNLLRDVLVDDN